MISLNYHVKYNVLLYCIFIIYLVDEKKKDNQINDKNTVQQNIIFDMIIQANSGRGHPIHQTPVLDAS